MADTALRAAAPNLCPVLAVVDGTPTTTSIEVAQHFGKDHAEVLKRIRALLPELVDHAGFFAAMVNEVQIGSGATRQDPAYRITRDGFTLLAMGFTGKRALQFKLAYIDAFNRMEAKLAGRQLPALPPAATQALPEPDRLQLAFALATEVASQVQRTVFQAVMQGDEQWRHDRWMFALNYDRDSGKINLPWAKAIDRDSLVVSLQTLAERIGNNEVMASTQELANLGAACAQRLARHIATMNAPARRELQA